MASKYDKIMSRFHQRQAHHRAPRRQRFQLASRKFAVLVNDERQIRLSRLVNIACD
jgi:hypothetical protein